MITEQEAQSAQKIKTKKEIWQEQVNCPNVNSNNTYTMVCKTVTNCEFVLDGSMSLFWGYVFSHFLQTLTNERRRIITTAVAVQGQAIGRRTWYTFTSCSQSVSCDRFWVRRWIPHCRHTRSWQLALSLLVWNNPVIAVCLLGPEVRGDRIARILPFFL
jgi:hypothetical protein